ncbi:protein 60A-like isoform X2 [Malaya genurostris]|uniref:protein 60A-like isoform X2 n=1 Tax=Malaya genurostris TaxID=325434 RepID=UPI0026F3F3C5|nr:protein 60A-like isoform X2 [Malaya genurostris]
MKQLDYLALETEQAKLQMTSKSAPQFLLSIYDKLSHQTSGYHARYTRSPDTKHDIFTQMDNEAIDQSDIIMTFLNKNHHVSEIRHEKGRRLWFETNSLNDGVELIFAELRLRKCIEPRKHTYNTENFTVAVYSITNLDGQEILLKLSEIDVSPEFDGWIELNVTSAVLDWTNNEQLNRGLYVEAYSKLRTDKEIKLDDIGIVSSKGNDKYQPFLVTYCKGSQVVKPVFHIHSRSKRNVQRKRKNKTEARNPLTDPITDHYKSCQIKTLYVSFKDLNWQDWIIAPEGYGAFYCSGECNFPLNAHMNATNHAIVQTLVHLMHPSKVPKPCCAPTKLSPISVLYHIDESNVNLKKYKNMVVKSCGCH